MRLTLIFIYLSIIVSAKHAEKGDKAKKAGKTEEAKKVKTEKPKQLRYIGDDSDYYDEDAPNEDTILNLRGSMRKLFAMEAALVDYGRNMICSPLSAMMPLGKLLLGAKKISQEELLEALGLTKRKQIKKSFGELIEKMEYIDGVTLDVASRVYVSSENSINEKFLRRTKQIFRSSCERIDVSNPDRTARSINNWVKEKTRDKITKIIDSSDIRRSTSLILVNAIYFAGQWKNKFGEPYLGNFQSPSGLRRIVLMTRQGDYHYYKSDTLNAQLVEIPYAGEEAAMVIVLPYSSSGLSGLLRKLKSEPDLLNDALEQMKMTNVILTMPKFRIETEMDLLPLYQKIGLRSIFDDRRSTLTGIIDDETVHVTKAVHKAFIEVNERGTEAAASTGVIISVASSPDAPKQIKFEAKHPFFFCVKAFREQIFTGVFNGQLVNSTYDFNKMNNL